MTTITKEQASAICRTVGPVPDDMTWAQALCQTAIDWAAKQQRPFLNAEEYLRHKYGAYRGFPAWREIEEGYNQGRYDEAMAQGPDEYPAPVNQELVERLRSFEIDHKPDGWPAIQMRDVSTLLDIVEGKNV